MHDKNIQSYISRKVVSDPDLPRRMRALKVYFDIALQISNRRKAAGLTQGQLAKRMDTTQPNIARWETPGYARYSISRLISIAEALNCRLQIRFVKVNEEIIKLPESSWEGSKPLRTLRSYNTVSNSDKTSAPNFSAYGQVNNLKYEVA